MSSRSSDGPSPALRRELALIGDLVPDIVSVIAADGRLLFNSAAAEKIHGFPPAEMIGRSTMDWVHPEDRGAVEAAFAQLVASPDEPVRVRYRYRHKNGGWTAMDATGRNLLADPRVNGILAISRDVSGRAIERRHVGLVAVDAGLYDPVSRAIVTAQGPVPLTPTEARLLEYFLAHADKLIRHEQLLREVWGYGAQVRSRTAYATVNRLRSKIERNPTEPKCLITVAQHGYRFVTVG